MAGEIEGSDGARAAAEPAAQALQRTAHLTVEVGQREFEVQDEVRKTFDILRISS